MAPAIDHGSGAARRPTDRARSARAIGTRAGGCRATGAGDSAVGRRPQLRHDRDDDGLQFADDRVVETPVRAGRPAGMGGPASRLETTVLTPALAARSMTWTRRPPPHGATQWSTRSLGRKLGGQHTIVARAWQQAGLQPPRLERYMRSTDPECETKAADVIGLYRDPPQHAAVFCVDEKTAIQALDRLDPVLPLSPGRAERHGVEYDRHGTLSLYAALKYADGRRRRSHGGSPHQRGVRQFSPGGRGHAASSARAAHHRGQSLGHKTQQVRTFLVAHPRVHLHSTPTYSSWLNQVELWFSKIERDATARGLFTSVTDLRRKLMRSIKHYNKTATPIRWGMPTPRGGSRDRCTTR